VRTRSRTPVDKDASEDTSEDALDDEDIGEDEVKNIRGEGAGFKGASEDALADEDTREDDNDDDSKNSDTSHDPENSELTREEAEVKWVIRNAVDKGEMRKQDEAPKDREDIKKELPAEADVTDDPEDDGSAVEDDREHCFQEEGFEDTKEMKDSSLSSTYLTRQSSTKPEAVIRYVDLPVLKLFVQFVSPSSKPGLYPGDVLMRKNEEKSQANQDEHGALDNKTMECEAMNIRKNRFEDSKRMKDEKNEETRDEGNHDEDKKKEAMLTIPDNGDGEVDVLRERGSMVHHWCRWRSS
jgi:hypothetical protein